jgi:hypothetical protein
VATGERESPLTPHLFPKPIISTQTITVRRGLAESERLTRALIHLVARAFGRTARMLVLAGCRCPSWRLSVLKLADCAVAVR